MSIQYSGLTIINTTFTMSTGTRLEIVNGLAAALSSAGWTNISGSGTGNQVWKSMTTPQGLAIRIQILDPGSGNCAQLFLQNATGSITTSSNPMYLFPTAGGSYRVIANGYQFFIFVPGSILARQFACGGVPYVPPFLTSAISAAGHLQSGTSNDTATGNCATCFRVCLYAGGGDFHTLYNSTLVSNWSANGQQLIVPAASNQNNQNSGFRYADASAMIVDALIGWPLPGTSNETQIVGQLWDACVITEAFNADVTATFDSHNWFNITNNNNVFSNSARGSLFVVVP